MLGRRTEMERQQNNGEKFSEALKSKYYIDTFSGCGGLSLGLGLAGWNGLFAVEKDPMAYATFEHNFSMRTHLINILRIGQIGFPKMLTL